MAQSETLAQELIDLEHELGAHNYHPLDVVLTRGEGVWVWDADGRHYLDVYNNVPHVGHCHPRVIEAAGRQAARLNTNTRYLHESFLDYADRLAARLPDPIDTVFLVNSGSEANELALRLAQAATGSQARGGTRMPNTRGDLAPATIENLRPGNYELAIMLDGWEKSTQFLRVERGAGDAGKGGTPQASAYVV